MTDPTASLPTVTTVADLLEALDGIPTNRIRLQPPPGMATEQDVIDVHDRENRLCELIDGVLVEKAKGFYESCLAIVLSRMLGNFLDQHNLGIVAGADGMLRLAPGLVRIPDVSFVSWDRLPNRQVPREPIPDLVPDLAVEVLSQSNTEQEMNRKLREYFTAGVRLVWFLDPSPRTMQLFTSPNHCITLSEQETLDGGDVLPGFALSLRELFDRAGRPPRPQG